MKKPEYRTKEEYKYWDQGPQGGEYKIIPARTFITPISENWIPKHIEKPFNADIEVMTWSSFGFTPLPKRLIEEC